MIVLYSLCISSCLGKISGSRNDKELISDVKIIDDNLPNEVSLSDDADSIDDEKLVYCSEPVENHFDLSYFKVIDNCSFEIDIINCPETVTFRSGTAHISDVDYKGIGEYYMEGKNYVVYDVTGELFVVNEDGIVEYVASQYGITYVDCFSPYINSIRYLPEDPNNNLMAYTEEREFSFGSAKECYSNIADIYMDYGMNIKDNVFVTTFYLDHKTLAEEELYLDHWGNDDKSKYKPDGWSEEDDAYMYFITQNCQGLPDLNWIGGFWEGVFDPLGDAGILIIYNKNGFARVEPRRMIVDYSLNDDYLMLLTFDEMANLVAEHLNEMVSDDTTYTITKARLYVAYDNIYDVGEEELELHWGFLVTEKSEQGSKLYELYFNAVTGEFESH